MTDRQTGLGEEGGGEFKFVRRWCTSVAFGRNWDKQREKDVAKLRNEGSETISPIKWHPSGGKCPCSLLPRMHSPSFQGHTYWHVSESTQTSLHTFIIFLYLWAMHKFIRAQRYHLKRFAPKIKKTFPHTQLYWRTSHEVLNLWRAWGWSGAKDGWRHQLLVPRCRCVPEANSLISALPTHQLQLKGGTHSRLEYDAHQIQTHTHTSCLHAEDDRLNLL